jgi:predicted metal-dependent TIM-barrel fold hydrolase
VVEDTRVTLEDLKSSGLSQSVIEAVDAITKRQGESYHDYIERLIQNPIALAVKIADIKHNVDLSRIPNPTKKDIQRTKNRVSPNRN